jgi:ribose transport system substrate-binding protein
MHRSQVRSALAVIAGAASVALLAGCSSASSGTGSSTGAPSTGAASTGTTAATAGLKAAQRMVDRLSTPVTQIAPPKLVAKPPSGKTIVCLENAEGGAIYVQICQNAQEAAQLLGWNVKTIVEDGSLAGVGNALTQALQLHPAGIEDSDGQEVQSYPKQFAEAKSEGVPIVWTSIPLPGSTTTTDGPLTFPIVGTQGGVYSNEQQFGGQAALIAVVSRCHAHVGIDSAESLPIIKVVDDIFKRYLANFCPTATTTLINNPIADMGTPASNNRVVSALEQDPSINYVVSPLGAWVSGLAGAIRLAGLSLPGIVVGNGTPSNIAEVNTGKELGITGGDSSWFGWFAIDSLARYYSHSPLVTEQEALNPVFIITKDTKLPSNVDPINGLSPATRDAQFKSAWLVG